MAYFLTLYNGTTSTWSLLTSETTRIEWSLPSIILPGTTHHVPIDYHKSRFTSRSSANADAIYTIDDYDGYLFEIVVKGKPFAIEIHFTTVPILSELNPLPSQPTNLPYYHLKPWLIHSNFQPRPSRLQSLPPRHYPSFPTHPQATNSPPSTDSNSNNIETHQYHQQFTTHSVLLSDELLSSPNSTTNVHTTSNLVTSAENAQDTERTPPQFPHIDKSTLTHHNITYSPYILHLPFNYHGNTLTLALYNSPSLPGFFQTTLALPFNYRIPPNWLSYHISLFNHVPIAQLTLPGSHDAGMFCIRNNSVGANASNTQCQLLSIYDQLMSGCRYFDLRPTLYRNSFHLGHFQRIGNNMGVGAFGPPVGDVIDEINRFTEQYDEFVILNFSHDIDVDNGYSNFSREIWIRFYDQLKQIQFKWCPAVKQVQDPTDHKSNNYHNSTQSILSSPQQQQTALRHVVGLQTSTQTTPTQPPETAAAQSTSDSNPQLAEYQNDPDFAKGDCAHDHSTEPHGASKGDESSKTVERELDNAASSPTQDKTDNTDTNVEELHPDSISYQQDSPLEDHHEDLTLVQKRHVNVISPESSQGINEPDSKYRVLPVDWTRRPLGHFLCLDPAPDANQGQLGNTNTNPQQINSTKPSQTSAQPGTENNVSSALELQLQPYDPHLDQDPLKSYQSLTSLHFYTKPCVLVFVDPFVKDIDTIPPLSGLFHTRLCHIYDRYSETTDVQYMQKDQLRKMVQNTAHSIPHAYPTIVTRYARDCGDFRSHGSFTPQSSLSEQRSKQSEGIDRFNEDEKTSSHAYRDDDDDHDDDDDDDDKSTLSQSMPTATSRNETDNHLLNIIPLLPSYSDKYNRNPNNELLGQPRQSQQSQFSFSSLPNQHHNDNSKTCRTLPHNAYLFESPLTLYSSYEHLMTYGPRSSDHSDPAEALFLHNPFETPNLFLCHQSAPNPSLASQPLRSARSQARRASFASNFSPSAHKLLFILSWTMTQTASQAVKCAFQFNSNAISLQGYAYRVNPLLRTTLLQLTSPQHQIDLYHSTLYRILCEIVKMYIGQSIVNLYIDWFVKQLRKGVAELQHHISTSSTSSNETPTTLHDENELTPETTPESTKEGLKFDIDEHIEVHLGSLRPDIPLIETITAIPFYPTEKYATSTQSTSTEFNHPSLFTQNIHQILDSTIFYAVPTQSIQFLSNFKDRHGELHFKQTTDYILPKSPLLVSLQIPSLLSPIAEKWCQLQSTLQPAAGTIIPRLNSDLDKDQLELIHQMWAAMGKLKSILYQTVPCQPSSMNELIQDSDIEENDHYVHHNNNINNNNANNNTNSDYDYDNNNNHNPNKDNDNTTLAKIAESPAQQSYQAQQSQLKPFQIPTRQQYPITISHSHVGILQQYLYTTISQPTHQPSLSQSQGNQALILPSLHACHDDFNTAPQQSHYPRLPASSQSLTCHTMLPTISSSTAKHRLDRLLSQLNTTFPRPRFTAPSIIYVDYLDSSILKNAIDINCMRFAPWYHRFVNSSQLSTKHCPHPIYARNLKAYLTAQQDLVQTQLRSISQSAPSTPYSAPIEAPGQPHLPFVTTDTIIHERITQLLELITLLSVQH